MADSTDTLEAYAERIERLWSQRLERTSVFSQREFDLIERWHRAGVPMAVVTEAMDSALEVRPGRAPRTPRNLGYIATAVEEAWETVRAGRIPDRIVTSEPTSVPEIAVRPEGPAPVGFTGDPWSEATEVPETGWNAWLAEFRRRYGAGDSDAAIDEEMDAGLIEHAPTHLVESCRNEVEGRLVRHRSRMQPEVYRSTLNRAWVDCLRRRLKLRRLHDSI